MPRSIQRDIGRGNRKMRDALAPQREVTVMNCPQCGSSNAVGSQFCSSCLALLPTSGEAPPVPGAPPPPSAPGQPAQQLGQVEPAQPAGYWRAAPPANPGFGVAPPPAGGYAAPPGWGGGYPPPPAGGQQWSAAQSMPYVAPVVQQQAPGAVVSLVFGIISLFICGLITGIVAVINGWKAYQLCEQNPRLYTGKGMAIAGMVIGAIGALGGSFLWYRLFYG